MSEPHHSGHRQRLRDRLMQSKKATLPEYEILEMLLALAKPRGDTKPLAKALLAQYGSLARVINADPTALAAIHGVGEAVVAVLRLAHEVSIRMSREASVAQPVLSSWDALLHYCRVSMGFHPTEQFRVIYLDRKNMVIADDLQEYGSISETVIFPKEVIKRALLINASALILVHNHPSGNESPSKADIILTREMEKMAITLGIRVHDHVIITDKGHFSFRSQGLLSVASAS